MDILLRTLSRLNPAYVDPFSLGAGAIIGFLGIGLGSPGQPHIVVRYMSIKNAEHLRFSTVIGTFWNVVMGWGAVCIGLLGRAIIPAVENLPDSNSEMVYLVLSSQYFGPVLYGLLIGGVFAAILSTADSQLLVASSALVRDTYEMTLEKRIEEKKLLIIIRITVLLLGILSLLVALTEARIVFWFVLFAWSGLGASFGPLIILLLNGYRFKASHIVTGMLLGFIITIVWKLSGLSDFLYEIIPAFFIAFIYLLIAGKKRQ